MVPTDILSDPASDHNWYDLCSFTMVLSTEDVSQSRVLMYFFLVPSRQSIPLLVVDCDIRHLQGRPVNCNKVRLQEYFASITGHPEGTLILQRPWFPETVARLERSCYGGGFLPPYQQHTHPGCTPATHMDYGCEHRRHFRSTVGSQRLHATLVPIIFVLSRRALICTLSFRSVLLSRAFPIGSIPKSLTS